MRVQPCPSASCRDVGVVDPLRGDLPRLPSVQDRPTTSNVRGCAAKEHSASDSGDNSTMRRLAADVSAKPHQKREKHAVYSNVPVGSQRRETLIFCLFRRSKGNVRSVSAVLLLPA